MRSSSAWMILGTVALCVANGQRSAGQQVIPQGTQEHVGGYYNPYTGNRGTTMSAYNPYTGRESFSANTYNATTGAARDFSSFYNPYTGRSGAHYSGYNPFTGYHAAGYRSGYNWCTGYREGFGGYRGAYGFRGYGWRR